MWVEKLARLGYIVKGGVYSLIGILAVQAALSSGGKTTDSKGAIRTIAAQPFGKILLIVVAVGLFGYALWRFIEAIENPESSGKSQAKDIIKRIGYFISGLIYGALAFDAGRIALGAGGGGSNGKSKAEWTAIVMQKPFGRWLIGTVGAIIIGLGVYRLYRAFKVKFRKRLDLSELSSTEEFWLVNVSRFGIAARGVVFLIIGGFLIRAAKQFDANEVKGLDGTLQAIAQQPFGKILLLLVALGLVAYGIYLWVQARYRRIKTS